MQISCVAGISPRQKEDRHSTWRILTDVEPHSAEQEDHSDVIHGEEQGWFSHFFIVSGLNSSRHFSGMTVESTPASIFNQQCAIRDFFRGHSVHLSLRGTLSDHYLKALATRRRTLRPTCRFPTRLTLLRGHWLRTSNNWDLEIWPNPEYQRRFWAQCQASCPNCSYCNPTLFQTNLHRLLWLLWSMSHKLLHREFSQRLASGIFRGDFYVLK